MPKLSGEGCGISQEMERRGLVKAERLKQVRWRLTRQAWLVQTLHIPNKGLALAQPLKITAKP